MNSSKNCEAPPKSNSLYDHSLSVTAFLAIILCTILPAEGDSAEYIWPLRVERTITSSFGEFREGHVHAGLDFSTGGREGLNVYCAADGYVERLRCSPFGYGKAIYVRLNDGCTAVYAHLSDYGPELRRRVETAQAKRIAYDVDIWLKAQDITVKSGDILGRTGSTGTGAPHLHFEIRASDGCPVNPYQFYDIVPDSVHPELGDIAVIPLDTASRVDGLHVPAVIPVKLNVATGKYEAVRPVHAHGRIGIAIEAKDRGSKGSYRRGIYLLEANADDTPIFSVRNDRFCYDLGRQLYLTYDFPLLRRTGRRFLKSYRDVGNTLSSYQQFSDGDGYLNIDDIPMTVVISAADDAGNTSEVTVDILPEAADTKNDASYIGARGDPVKGSNGLLSCTADFWPNSVTFKINSNSPAGTGTPKATIITASGKTIPLTVNRTSTNEYNAHTPLYETLNGPWTLRVAQPNSSGKPIIDEWTYVLNRVNPKSGGTLVSNDGMASVLIPADGLYRPLNGRIDLPKAPKNNGPGTPVGLTYSFGPTDEPLAAKCEIKLECPDGESTDKLGVYRLNGNGAWYFMSAYGTPATTFELGTFGLMRDETAPEVNIKSPAAGKTLGPDPLRVEIALKDEPAGIDLGSVRTDLDGQPIICEYHPPTRSLRYKSRSPLDPGTHSLKISVSDNVKNTTVRELSFTVRK